MSGEAVYFTTPVGRFVMGDAFQGSDKDHQGRPRTDQQGKPKMQYFVGLAIPKNDPGWAELWGQLTAVAQRDFPGGEWNRPDFAWKVVDGDVKYPDRAECAGCYIVRFSSGFAPTVYNAQNAQITDPAQCKRGDYVRLYASVKGNDDRQKPGVYVSHSMVQVVGYGEAINSGPSPDQAFGAPPSQLPPGASATPVASAPMPAPAGMPAAPQPQVAPAPMPAGAPPQAAPAPTPGTYAPPAPAVAPAPPVQTASPTDPAQPAVGQAQPAPYPQILNGPTQ